MKHSVNGTRDTVLFSGERRRTENTSVQNSANGTRLQRYFPKKLESYNNQVKNSAIGTQGAVLSSKEREQLKYFSEK